MLRHRIILYLKIYCILIREVGIMKCNFRIILFLSAVFRQGNCFLSVIAEGAHHFWFVANCQDSRFCVTESPEIKAFVEPLHQSVLLELRLRFGIWTYYWIPGKSPSIKLNFLQSFYFSLQVCPNMIPLGLIIYKYVTSIRTALILRFVITILITSYVSLPWLMLS